MYESRLTPSHVTLVRNALWEPPDLLETCWKALHPGGILVANAVTALE
jgi:precorrin-6B methylase 2